MMKRRLIDQKEIMNHIETQRRLWGDDYDVEQVLGDIEDAEVVDVPDICVGKWIPCSERLPEDGLYLVTCKGTFINYIEIVDFKHNRFFPILGEVIAWMPLPEPYKGE